MKLPRKAKKKQKKKKIPISVQFADELRSNMTKPERRFGKKLAKVGIIYKSQKIVKKTKSFYIIDFYIPSKNLCIELDGGYHLEPEQIEKDKERDEYLKMNGYAVWRMTNEEADKMTVEQVVQTLAEFPDRKRIIRIAATVDAPYNYYPNKSKKKWGNPRSKRSKSRKPPPPMTPERQAILDRLNEKYKKR